MKLIVGLGNPGKKYEKTRHNMGFLVIDQLASVWKETSFKDGFSSQYIVNKEKNVILCKPQTFMNLSGEAVYAISQYYKIDIKDIVIIYDDLALDPGMIRLRLNGSSGSHNGMQSVIDHLKTNEVKRIRIGIGSIPSFMQGKDYVLHEPSVDESKKINDAVIKAVQSIETYLRDDFLKAMNEYNRGPSD
jgi:peptidyl-tRNA hydrolase, PTH1 family